ncbi:predicted protein [Nematostella vectensis]|uniref:TNFR-Cys domain-containing protein n=1 Tax=Nematostella vectensis TaxID=45351 RepID=A7SEK9_NEMVE|nr:predicted protein [Nematostella vectensis]|eukprot:XP_001629959.1 predicted protein [Nematostella vectensis]
MGNRQGIGLQIALVLVLLLTRMQNCPFCPEGQGVEPLCGSDITPNIKPRCVNCVEGINFSASYDQEQCRPCYQCDNQLVSKECTVTSNRVCLNKCKPKSGMYFDILYQVCEPCSWCCGDANDVVEQDCIDQGLPPKKRCNLDGKKRCTPKVTPIPSTTATPSTAVTSSTPPTSTSMQTTKHSVGHLQTTVSISLKKETKPKNETESVAAETEEGGCLNRYLPLIQRWFRAPREGQESAESFLRDEDRAQVLVRRAEADQSSVIIECQAANGVEPCNQGSAEAEADQSSVIIECQAANGVEPCNQGSAEAEADQSSVIIECQAANGVEPCNQGSAEDVLPANQPNEDVEEPGSTMPGCSERSETSSVTEIVENQGNESPTASPIGSVPLEYIKGCLPLYQKVCDKLDLKYRFMKIGRHYKMDEDRLLLLKQHNDTKSGAEGVLEWIFSSHPSLHFSGFIKVLGEFDMNDVANEMLKKEYVDLLFHEASS